MPMAWTLSTGTNNSPPLSSKTTNRISIPGQMPRARQV
jgi:hypothetical protein